MTTFSTIPIDLRVPGAYFEFDNSNAVQGPPGQRRKSLIVGTMDAAVGTATAGQVYLISDDAMGDTLFGRTSMLAAMIRAFRKITKFAETYACGLADGTTAAVKTLTFSVAGVTTTKASSLPIYVGGYRTLTPIPAGADDDAVAAAVEATLDAKVDDLVVTATVALNGVTCTLNFRGEVGSDLDIRLGYHDTDVWDPAITMAVAETVPGAGNSGLSAMITSLGSTQYNVIANPFLDATNLTALEAELASRWGAMAPFDGHAYGASIGDVSTLQTLGNSRNSPHITIQATGPSPTPPWIWAAQLAACRAKEPDTSMQLRGLKLPDCMAPKLGAEFTATQMNTLLFDGISTYTVSSAREVYVGQTLTTYEENASAVDDPSYYKEVTMTNLSTLRWEARTMMGLKHGNKKLAPNGTRFKPGQPVVTPALLRLDFLALYRSWEDRAKVVDYDGFAEEVDFDLPDGDPNRVDIQLPPRLIKHLDVTAAKMMFR